MNGIDNKDYFLQPAEPAHRRYEALRAVVVDEQPLKEVAQQFDISYGTLRNWHCEFHRARVAGQSPPFSSSRCEDAPPNATQPAPTLIRKSRSPMFANCRWRQDAD